MSPIRIEGCVSQEATPLIEVTEGCDANCSKCNGTTSRVGPESCFRDPSGSGAMMRISNFSCVAPPPPGRNATSGTDDEGSDPRDEVCYPVGYEWWTTGCYTFYTQRCNGAELRFAESAACGPQFPCKASIHPSAAAQLLNVTCTEYCRMHNLTCVAAWFPGPTGERCDLQGAGVKNASCGAVLFANQTAEPMCECGGFTSTPTGPTSLETSIASQCMSIFNRYLQCMETFRQSDPDYYHASLPAQDVLDRVKERIVWAGGMTTTPMPSCAFIPKRIAQRLGALPCPAAAQP